MIKNYLLLLALIFFSFVNAQTITIPDANFKAKLLEADVTNKIAQNIKGEYIKIDLNGDGEIQESEALQIAGLIITKSSISTLEGIKKFKNLSSLDCSENQLTELDVSDMISLQVLYLSDNQLVGLNLKGLVYLDRLSCSSNQLEKLNIEGLYNLTYLAYSSNRLTNVDISSLKKLSSLSCGGNPLVKLDLKGLTNLYSLSCESSGLTALDLNGLTRLTTLQCDNNNLTSLDLKGSVNLFHLECSNNKLKKLDLSGLNKIEILTCGGNEFTTLNIENLSKLGYFTINNSPFLETIFMKNGTQKYASFSYHPSPNLKYICTDDYKVSLYIQSLIKNGNINCVVNSYCSFIPGGPLYSIQGKIGLDKNNNGCDAFDINVSNMKFSITDGVTKGNFITNESGNYFISVPQGSHTITPLLENPSYFNVYPSSIQTNPTFTGQVLQNFCLSPNNAHKDLEIVLLPIDAARPGFDASYKIIYKNKGNVTQSGSVGLTYNDAILDIVSSSSVSSSQAINNAFWSFVDLKPFETREIAITLNINSPMETPAVNNDDILSYTATISSSDADETPNDNAFTLNQKVVGSYDPNDKTCLEGDVITSSLIGEYVHYMIRFENTGTYPAQNVVVTDIIDLTKFDISTLIPTNASHSYITKISDKNKVEFIFENIQLPFDNANNDGYIAFKIKTLPTLSVGDSFQNEANIFFDYNFPILTNKAISTFRTLGTQDFEFSNYLSVFPVPAKEILNVSAKGNIEIKSMAIYNLFGQLVIAVPNAQNAKTIDVSPLKTGTYFLTIKSDKGTSNTKFIKE
ncbi:DUF7619 domain-containing protein [Flavobacterium hydatis]|uniref:Internalin n=1 Tax=Flavobacterium hydatis TaxID=991 RepID=A0A086AEK6_FLAHY|nr:T9SS type A sorting domain-containing protein [Flavobacterium hydatis]KFF15120.1 internalin [Flavobacterium hydatis]OXA91940.1 T9SS C-terminal target domain-containing protein [Flavobacterium hydatis]